MDYLGEPNGGLYEREGEGSESERFEAMMLTLKMEEGDTMQRM